MDNKDIYSLKDKSKMDANTVWQWRIMRVNKYSRRPEPFHHSNRIGLDFNVGSSTKKKLDLQFVTNGVILEICDFAKIVNKSKRSFITNILENNFDLGLENEQQRIDFTSRILHKVKDLIRKPPKDKNEVFTLFDTSSKPEFSSNDGLNMASTELTESFLVEMDDTDDSEHEDEFKCSEATSKEYFKTEGLSEEVAGAHGDDSEHEEEFKCSEAQSAEELKEDVLSPSFPYCEEIGLCLDIGSKQSLDPGLLTKGVMLELVHFTKILTASYSPIVLAVLEHNFELDLKSQQAKYRVWFKISQLLKRRKRLISTGSKISLEFKNEPFSFHTCPFKRTRGSALTNMEAPQYQFKEVTKQRQSDLKCKQQKRALLPTTERVNKKYKRGLSEDMETSTLSHCTDLSISHTVERDHSHTCPQGNSDLDSNTGNQCDMEPKEMEMENNYIRPLGESDLDSDKVMDSGNSGNQDRLQNSKSSLRSDVPKESESSYLGVCAPFLIITDVRSILPTVKSNVNPPFASQPDERGFCTSEKQTETQGNASNNYDMDQEEMGTENIMWKLRANRVKQILSEFHLGVWSRNNGLEFNVGCGPKQNIRADSFTNPALLEVAHVALALNSSQQNFIMEILEYNFNFYLQSEQQREVLSCEIVKRIRQLKECKDAVKLSKEVFELAGVMPSINVTNQSIDHVKEECDDVPVCPPQSHVETEEHISQKGVDLYPFCKEIGLKLQVNHSQPIKKLDINRLTNGAMTEVADFAEKLCGTFDQICLDILRHNLESGDSDPARNILARIPAVVDRNNLITSRSSDNRSFQKQKRFAKKTITAQGVSSSINIAHKNALDLKLWQLRASHIKQILSIPHQEHCPLYSYSRCKKLGIDFNVGSGVKQNLDPKLLTNGIMAELTAFTTTLLKSQKYFITEILEYNFNIHFKNELHCSAFAQKTMGKVKAMHATNKHFNAQMNELFELPDTGCIEELPDMRCIKKKTTYCPKCYQDRNNKLHQDESDLGHMHHHHPHIMTDAVSADANCTAQKPAKDPSSTFSAIEEMIMNSYPLCKNIGLNLCVDKGQPKHKLDLQLLTCKVMNEVAYFAKELSGTKKREILNDVIEHNFNITLLQRDICPGPHFFNMALRDFREDWFNEVFVIPPILQKTPSSNRKRAATMQSSEWKETCKKRKLALQTKEESATLSSHNASVLKKTKTNPRGRVLVDCYPICTEIGLDLDMTSKSREKEKLDLKLLTRAVVFEIHKFAIKKKGCYLPHSLYEILDYNFDLSSQHHRCWEFSLATAFKVQTMVKQYLKKLDRSDEVFELPFVFEERQNWKKANVSPNIANKSSFPDICESFFTSTDISSSLPAVNSNVNPPFASQPDKRGLNGREEQTLTPRNVPNKYEMEQEEMAIENNYICPLGESDLDSDKVTDSEDTGEQDHLHNPIILREPESSHLGVCSLSLTTTDVSAILETVNSNVNPPFQGGESGLCGGEEPTQTSGHSPNECDLDQEEMGTVSNMWKLRANRVKQILSASEFCSFNSIKCMGLVFNVGSFPKQNINIDLLTRSLLFEVAQFALAMNSSQQNFIMEILEYNFNFYLQSEQQREVLSREIMKRIRQLKECKDEVKLSKEVFELSGFMSSTHMTNLSMSSVKEECDDVPVCRPHSHAETKDNISQERVDLYPFCKEIDLKLHVNNSPPNKKLDINRLTNGAMAEVTHFAKELCGTFDQICLDILRHNFNLDLQSGDSDIARNILAHIPFIVDQKNLSNCSGFEGKFKRSLKLDFQNKPTVGACSARSPQATMTHQDARSSTDIEYQNEDNLKLWQLRANHVQQILSVPHLEDCPFYSYSRCKKLGIDFNVGFGVKQNLDPKLLTNGLMVELNTFATALLSAQKYFITDILECNFDLDLKDELHHSAFAQQIIHKVKAKYSKSQINNPFELPDMRYIKKSTTYCPKCYQDRNHRLRQDESDPGHMQHPRPHAMTDTVPADANCATQKSAKDPSSTFSAIVDNYPRCKKIGLKLCVDKDHSKDKLDMHLLTRGVMNEVVSFTNKMCGSKMKILKDVLEHNFNVGMKGRQIHIAAMFRSRSKQNGKQQMDWFSEVFPILQYTFKGPVNVSRAERAKLALEAKEEGSTPSSHMISIGKSDSIPQIKENCFPIFKEMGLDQDMASVSGNSEELDMKLLTRAVSAMEQEEIRAEDYYTCPLGESDLDSDEVTDSEDKGNQGHLQNPKCCSLSSDIPRESESSFGSVCAPSLTTTDVSSSLQTVNPNMNPPFANQTDESELGGGEGPTIVSNEYHMSQEEMGTGNIMWKLRANRVKQILSAFQFGSLRLSKKYGLEFSVGLGPKRNMSPDNITNALLLEVAKFTLAINSSQQNFIMEILEYNFNFYLQSEQQREVLICEIMNRVRQLKECEDAVKLSKGVFQLAGPMSLINMGIDHVKEECDDVPVCRPHSHADTKDHISQERVDLYPFCKEIGLQLHVNNSRPNKKLDINRLTNGAMTEVANFAEELCGTFDQICLDILGHNFDLDLQSGDSVIARNMLAQIPAIVDQKNLSNCTGFEGHFLGSRIVKLDFQNKPPVVACSAPFSQATMIQQDARSSSDIEYQNEDNLKLWQLRAKHVQQILSVPHLEDCPFYSYPRCKKLGIDFNVGFGVQQNLDPKLLTNGLMAELNTFATALLSAQKYFITDILECNFDIDLKDELYRSAFAQQTMQKVKGLNVHKNSKPRINNPFELPDMRCIQKSTTYCPKCYQDRNHRLRQDESDPGHMHRPRPHTLTDTVPADANCAAQKSAKDPSSSFSAIVDNYPRCKKIGLKLCVDKDHSKDKLDMHLLTRGVMNEVASFTRKMCGSKMKIVKDVIEHNFNVGMKGRRIDIAAMFRSWSKPNIEKQMEWFNEVFPLLQYNYKGPVYVSRAERAKLALEAKEEESTPSSHNISIGKSNTIPQSKENRFPIFKGIGLDQDMASVSGNTEELGLKLLTRAVCTMEQEEIRAEDYYTCPLGESDLDSDEVTDSEDTGNQGHLQNPKCCSLSSDIPRESESSFGSVCAPSLTTTDVSSSLQTVNPNVNPPFANQTDESELGGGEGPTIVSNKYHMDQEEMGTGNIMWKLRANRVKQILSAFQFGWYLSKKYSLEFNVGFGPKQNMSVTSLTDSFLMEVAKFALAMNSSQQNFIMEILEYNFNFYLQSEAQREVLSCEIVKRIRQLKECKDAVKFSKEVFELPGPVPSIDMTNPGMDSVKEECDDAPVCRSQSHAETEEHISQKSVDLYPFCKEIGLKLHVNNSRPNKKLDINRLTNGAMTEVANFAEELCGTFDQICLDILGHNFDLELQRGNSDIARNILARIPATVDRKNLTNCAGFEWKVKGSQIVKLDFQNNPPVGACSARSPQATMINQDVRSSTDIEYQNEDNLKLWQLRANHVQQILTVPHLEDCPFYSYSRCKTLGIDFNVGFGVKQNLDPKLLTNGIMAELNTFATALISAQKYFITDILECNFDLDLNDELYRSAFAQQIIHKVKALTFKKKYSKPRINNLFELPDMRCIQKSTTYCPKCYQDRNLKLRQDKSDPGHMHCPRPHTVTDAVPADANCATKKSANDPSSTLAIEETLMDNYPRCKKIGLKLCVDKDHSKDKLDMHLLTRGVMNEVASFTNKMCGSKMKIVKDVLEHNFNIGLQGQMINAAVMFRNYPKQKSDKQLDWFNEVFPIQESTRKVPVYVSSAERVAAARRSERKDAVKRQLALQAKEERSTPSSHKICVGKSNTNPQSKENCFPVFKGICLAQDMASVSGNTEELGLKLLTRAVCVMEQVEVRADNYYTCPLEDSDLDSDEFKDSEDADNQDQLQNPERCFVSSGIPRESESSHLGLCALALTTTDVSSSLPAVKSNVNPPFASQPDERGFCTSGKQTQTQGNSSNNYDMDQEEMETENIMWKLRGNRVKQILSEFECGPFNWSKNNGLEFNVGFGPKQNISADSFSHSTLLEVAKFALAMNSSQQNFIMEILEYNFNFYLKSEQQRDVLICEIMNRVRQLKECEDAVKLSKEVFQLAGPMSLINMGIDHVKECDDVPVCRPHSHADTKDHISQKSVDLYPFCKEIGLQLHVNNSQPNKKLDINRLTNGAMTEVANFAEELCGTFDQICLDILRHNLDLDLQSGDSDIAKNILARIPAIVDHNNLLSCLGPEGKLKGLTLDFQNNPTVGECCARSSQATMMYQDVRSSTDIKYQNEDNLKLWQLRANRIQQILSVPHLEDCPLYSYSRCKKLGIDFNVGFGVKQNLDPKLLTNGIMVELNTFAAALISAQKYFITDILECNFDLDLKDELHRSAFAQQIIHKVNKKQSKYPLNKPFELPDMRCIQKSTTYCTKCYQDRNHKLRQNESDPDHMHHPRPHTVTDAVPADANCATKKSANNPSTTLSAIEETLMDNYPRCKKIGLKLCVDKDQRKDKLDMHLLTRGVMDEVVSFTKKLSGTKVKSLNDVIEHNFKICMKGPEISPGALFQRVLRQNNDTRLAWYSEVFVIQQSTPRAPGYVIREERDAAMHQSKWKEAVNTRQLALQAKEEGATLSSHNINVEKSKTIPQGKEKCLPIFKGIAFDQDAASVSGNKEEPDLKLLTGAVCDMKQEEIETDNYYTRPLGESDLDSDEVKDSEDSGNQDQLQNPERSFVSSGIPRESESSHLGLCALSLATTDVSSSLPAVKSNVNPPFASQPDERGFCTSEKQTQTHGNSSIKYDMDQEEMETENIMWKLRGNRVKQILSEFECGPFNWSKNNGLEFNVGFGPKQNISADSFSHSALLEVAKFALAMNSSQENFIMEILEYNFNFYLQSEQQRDVLICEIMNRVRQLKECEDAVKLSKGVFQLAGPMSLIIMGIDHVKEECDDVPVCRPHSHADTKDHISQERVDLYPFCKEIGLQLHVNNSQPNKKLDINRLTNGAMTEVANFAEELCGTFEQICLDILKHNLDLDLQSGDSDIARSIVAQIHAVMKEMNQNTCVNVCKKLEGPRKVSSIKVEQDCQNNPNLDACTSGSSRAATIAQDISKSPKIELQNELESKMWQLQANHIQQILSIPHEEQCPLYSYRRCKKLGIDFNVGSGVKQNLDPKLLTNGIMVELNAFATALLSSQKYFITEILEHNFHLDFDSELHRSSFAQQTMQNVTKKDIKKQSLKNLSFELPDTKSTQEPTFESTYCPKCYQSRNLKLRQHESDSGHMHHAHQHTMTSAVCVDMNCTAQKQTKDASSTFSTIEKRIMDSYPLCKKAGLNLFVDKDPPKVKLEDHVLTRGMMNEVVRFAKRLCIKKSKIIHSLLEHNFNIGMQGQDIDLALCFRRAAPLKDLKDGGLAWFDDVFEFEFFQPVSHRKPEQVRKVKQTADMHQSERKETIKKRQLALRAKMETSTLGVKKSFGKKSKAKARCKVSVNCYPNCTEIGLDLDVTPQSREKEKLDLKLLTRAVVFEIHKFATKQKGCYLPHTVFNILDYNFDLSSQHHRRWEFSIATTYTIITMVKNYRHHRPHPNKVVKLPFVFDQKDSQSFPKERQKKRTKNTSKGHFVRQVRYHLGMNRIHFLDGVTNKEVVGCRDEDKQFSKDLGTNLNLLHVDCGSPLQGNLRIKEEEYDPCSSNMTVELGTDEKEHPQYDIKTESTTTGC